METTIKGLAFRVWGFRGLGCTGLGGRFMQVLFCDNGK